ncbi:hypothetical protein [Streptomyces sp. MUSC 14]|nr:hypothetical protein [Streptomyces sp. MUSC 14]
MAAGLLERYGLRAVPGHEVTPVERLVLRAADGMRTLAGVRSPAGHMAG